MQQILLNCRAEVCKALGMAEDQCELSMGMSGDFEQAVYDTNKFKIKPNEWQLNFFFLDACYFIFYVVPQPVINYKNPKPLTNVLYMIRSDHDCRN